MGEVDSSSATAQLEGLIGHMLDEGYDEDFNHVHIGVMCDGTMHAGRSNCSRAELASGRGHTATAPHFANSSLLSKPTAQQNGSHHTAAVKVRHRRKSEKERGAPIIRLPYHRQHSARAMDEEAGEGWFEHANDCDSPLGASLRHAMLACPEGGTARSRTILLSNRRTNMGSLAPRPRGTSLSTAERRSDCSRVSHTPKALASMCEGSQLLLASRTRETDFAGLRPKAKNRKWEWATGP